MQTEGDFPLCFTALDRGLCSGSERTLVAIKQHPTRRGAQSQHSWFTPRACVSPQLTVTHSSLVLEMTGQALCFCIHKATSHSWPLPNVMVCFKTSELWRNMFKDLINDRWLFYKKVYRKHLWSHLFCFGQCLSLQSTFCLLWYYGIWAVSRVPWVCVFFSPRAIGCWITERSAIPITPKRVRNNYIMAY